jgi:hypothetical protein
MERGGSASTTRDQHKARKIGAGKGARQLPQAAPVKIQARLLDGDLGIFEAAAPTPAATQAQPASVIAPVATAQNAG